MIMMTRMGTPNFTKFRRNRFVPNLAHKAYQMAPGSDEGHYVGHYSCLSVAIASKRRRRSWWPTLAARCALFPAPSQVRFPAFWPCLPWPECRPCYWRQGVPTDRPDLHRANADCEAADL